MQSRVLLARSLAGVAGGSAGLLSLQVDHRPVAAATWPRADRIRAPPIERRAAAGAKPGEPRYTRAQVASKDGADGRPMWMSYRDGVYDVTQFQKEHPGGSYIQQAAGADVGPFWDIWAYHHSAPLVGRYLEKLRVGKLIADNGGEIVDIDSTKDVDPYEAEPTRVGEDQQRIFYMRPYVSETPNEAMCSSYLTSAAALYVRNHAPVPDMAWPDSDDDSVEARAAGALKHEVAFGVDSADDGATTLTLKELEARFGRATITSILQCAGNRASEDIAATGPAGFTGTNLAALTNGQCGNAQWSGVRLAKVLPALFPQACAEEDNWHVVFEGADGYYTSTPLSRVIGPANDCLLASHMNGEPLSPDHGYPVRALLPGVAGARNAKWVQSITLSREPCDGAWNQYYYRDSTLDHIQELPLNSMILSPAHGTKYTKGTHTAKVSGVAFSGATGRSIARLDVSVNGGKTWLPATLHKDEELDDDSTASFGWLRWTAEVPLRASGPTEVVARATDVAGTTQPEASSKQRGYIYNGWSRVTILAQ